MKKTPITIAFSDYTGPQEYHPSIQYIAKKFKEQKKSGPQAFCHLTFAICSRVFLLGFQKFSDREIWLALDDTNTEGQWVDYYDKRKVNYSIF